MKGRTRIGIIIIGLAIIGFIAWQWKSDGVSIENVDYPGFINHVDLGDDARVVAQWEIQKNTLLAVLDKDPEDLSSRESLAFMYFMLGDYAKARRNIEAVIAKNSINYATWILLGDISNKMEDYKTAEASYIKSLSLATDPSVFRKLESLWRREFPERDADIEKLYLQAVSSVGQDSFYMTRLSVWYAEHERWSEAASHLKVILDTKPDDEDLRKEYEGYLQKAKEAEKR